MAFQNVLITAEAGTPFSGVGRVLSRRNSGKISFWTLRFKEDNVQLVLAKEYLANYAELLKVSTGSLIHVTAVKCVTNNGTHSLQALGISILHRYEGMWPDRYHKLAQDTRYEQRIMDLLVTPGSIEMVRGMSIATKVIRETLHEYGFHECNTGVLQNRFEAGAAKPFVTTSNATCKKMYLSLTSELKLKRLVAGGLERVYEIAQSFRNEGVDRMHAPEFTLLEAYGVQHTCEDMMKLVQTMFIRIFERLTDDRNATGIPVIQEPYSVVEPFEVITFDRAFKKYVGEIPCTLESMVTHDPTGFNQDMGTFTWLMKVIEKFIVPRVVNPTFLTSLPEDMSPLTKRADDGTTERAFFLVNGLFVADIYTDENDETKVREALKRQAETQNTEVNTDFIEVLALGIPPTAGLGMGLNRLFMAFTGNLPRHIKETTPFSPF
ncbi:MAG TPA: hypothetical protein PK295_03835 [Candidatus Magasanikbacteria bacterium]|nr:hypothetical protein [Candidatus Magasanikbacteria bacterium]